MPQVQNYMKRFFTSSNNVFLNIIDNNGKIRLIFDMKAYSGFAEALMNAISYSMDKKYGKKVAFYPEKKIGDFLIVKCLTLSNDDLLLKEKFAEIKFLNHRS